MGKGGSYDGSALLASGVISMGDVTLPVTLSSFNAVETASNFVSINWATESETNMLGFNVKRNEENNLDSSTRINQMIITPSNSSTGKNYSVTDDDVASATSYFYWLESVDLDGSREFFGPVAITTSGNGNETPDFSTITNLHGAYPNPFNPTTTIKFDVKEGDIASLNIYNAKGQKVCHLGKYGASGANTPHQVIWEGTNEAGQSVGSGVFYYSLESNNSKVIKKMLLMK
jgi:hypothetical protein